MSDITAAKTDHSGASALPKTPVMANAQVPEPHGAAPIQSLTTPPSSQPRQTSRILSPTPELASINALSSPPSTVLAAQAARISPGETASPDIKVEDLALKSAETLRADVTRLLTELRDAKTTAAHFKLQHQMSELESGEAVERMAVEMQMARREIEVLQRAEAQRNYLEQHRQPAQDANFKQVHNEVYSAMMDDIRDLKTQNSNLERDLVHARKVLGQQEEEIASLNDKVLLMRERMRESREQLFRYRQSSTTDNTPRASRVSAYPTPAHDRFKTIQMTPQADRSQPGFAALLQASGMVDHKRDSAGRGHYRNAQSLSSVPTTPTRPPPKLAPYTLYTPQRPREDVIQVPATAPAARKRVRDITPPTASQAIYESDGTVSVEDDSEAETEVAEGDVGESRASQAVREMLRSPTRQIKRAKSAYNMNFISKIRSLDQASHRPAVPRSVESSQEGAERSGPQSLVSEQAV